MSPSKKKKKPDLPYRSCVGIMLLNAQGRVWIGDRLSKKGGETSGTFTWQMPQGGIDKGEEPVEAARRELAEETGTDKAEIIAQCKDWLTYDLPDELIGRALKGKYRGQKQKWFAMRFKGTDADIDLNAHNHPEFSRWRWADIDELVDLIVPFKRDIYRRLVEEFRPLTTPSNGAKD